MIDVEKTLLSLDLKLYSQRGAEVQGLCPMHKERTGKEDHNPSWWINAETGAHICFSCGFKGNLWSLIASVQGLRDANGLLDYADAKDWLYLSFDNVSFGSDDEDDEPAPKEPINITEARLALFTYPPQQALSARGLTLEAARKYQLLWDPAHSNWITTVREPYSNKLLGWQEKGFSRRYFNNYPPGMEKSTTLYGFNNYQGGQMIVVESPLDVVRLESVGITGGVSTYGALVSKAQLNLIRDADDIIFAMDNDEAGFNSSKRLLESSIALGFEARFFNYAHTEMKDVGGMSKSEIMTGLANAKHVVYGEDALR